MPGIQPGATWRTGTARSFPLEEHLRRHRLGEPAGELLTVVGQHLRRHAVAVHRGGEGLAHRAPVRHREDRGDDNVAGVVVNPGQQLELPPIGQIHPADQIQLPQMHRRFPLPPLVLTRVVLLLGPDQTVTDQHPVHCRLRRHPPVHHDERARTPAAEHPTDGANAATHTPAPRSPRRGGAGCDAVAATAPQARPGPRARTAPSTCTPTAATPRTATPPRPPVSRCGPPTPPDNDAQPATTDPTHRLPRPRSRADQRHHHVPGCVYNRMSTLSGNSTRHTCRAEPFHAIFSELDLWQIQAIHFDQPTRRSERPSRQLFCRCGFTGTVTGYPHEVCSMCR